MLAHYSDLIRAEELKGTPIQYMRLLIARKQGQDPEKAPSPLMMFDKVRKDLKGMQSHHYLRKLVQTRDHLADYAPTIDWHDFTRAMLAGYVAYLTQIHLSNATIKEHIKMIRKVLREAEAMGVPVPKDAYHFTHKVQTQQPMYLSWPEVQAMQWVDLEDTAQAIIRDTFIFRCFTGIRWGDMPNIQATDHYKYCNIQIAKQKKPHRIALPPVAAGILQKYGGVLPVYAQQTENEYIKRVAEAAGILDPVTRYHYSGSTVTTRTVAKCRLISSHTARRTFARHWVVDMKGSIFNLSKYLGHSSVKVTMDYIGVTEDEINEEALRIFS
jgi:integrase